MKRHKPLLFRTSKADQDMLDFPTFFNRCFVDEAGQWAGWAARIENESGHVSNWHHHPASDTYVFIIRGSLTIHFGVDGAESIQAHSGDLLHIPAQVVHRETTSPESALDAIVFRIGGPPESVDVDSPVEFNKDTSKAE